MIFSEICWMYSDVLDASKANSESGGSVDSSMMSSNSVESSSIPSGNSRHSSSSSAGVASHLIPSMMY